MFYQQCPPFSLSSVCSFLDTTEVSYTVEGTDTWPFEGFCALDEPQSRCVTWIKSNSTSFEKCKTMQGMLIICSEVPSNLNASACFIVVANPKAVFFSVRDHFVPFTITPGISPTAVVESEMVSPDAYVGPRCYIGPDVQIAAGASVEAGAIIACPAHIGKGARILPGAILGGEGVGYWQNDQGQMHRIAQTGSIEIGADAFIGSGAVIARGAIGTTYIGDRAHIDSLVHIGHNCKVMHDAIVIASATLCGSVTVEPHTWIAANATVMNQVTVGEGSTIGLGAVVLHDVEPGTTVVGVPAHKIR